MTSPRLGVWVLASRPKTLPAAFAPVAVGTALGAAQSGELMLSLALFTLGSTLAIQIATNLFNDALDFAKGSDTALRMGPLRAAASGLLTPRQLITGAALALVVATLLSLPLIFSRGWPLIAIGLPSFLLCYAYTGGPYPLAYRGLGELFVLIFFGWIAVIGSAFVQTGYFSELGLLLGTQIGLLSVALIAINNLRDREEDLLSQKRTLAVRFGINFARWEILLCLFGPYFVGLLWAFTTYPSLVAWPLPLIPMAVVIARAVWKTPPGAAYNSFLALTGLHLLVFSILMVLGFYFSKA